MKKITIAFDVDGTLISNLSNGVEANERIRTLLIALSSFKNTKIVVWSGGGELYARQAVREMGLHRYVDAYYDKHQITAKDSAKRHNFKPDITPDIAIDDIQDCTLGRINLIVREK
jgi:phosphoserine phosphatase